MPVTSKVNTVCYGFIAFLFLASCHYKKEDISQINFETLGCSDNCTRFTMSIMENGAASYREEVEGFLSERGKISDKRFRTVIKKPQLDSLLTLITDAQLLGLSSYYEEDAYDAGISTLTLKLKNGRKKIIEDRSVSSPKKLERIYNFLYSLRESQDWE